jgi:hypothetical protein
MLSHSSALPIRISTFKQEGILQVSKWIKAQVLLSIEEMHHLIEALQPCFFVVVSEPISAQDALITPANFIEQYSRYVAFLQRGEVPPVEEFRRLFSCAVSTYLEAFYAITAGEKFLIKPIQPIVQLQAHHFFYSPLDQKFHPMVFSAESVSWGIQFSYPQLYQDPTSRHIIKVSDPVKFPNTLLFSKLMKWMRNATLPTPFEIEGKRVNAPIRIGKQSLGWVKKHPQLQKKHIDIAQINAVSS